MLPKKVFIYEIEEGDDVYLDARYTAEDIAVKGEVRIVGVYELKEQLEVTLEVKETVRINQAA